MDQKAKTLLSMYKPDNIYDNFGEVIRKLTIKGMKGTNCTITFDFPITAISGYNGAGKSTIAQIALCLYRCDSNGKRKYLKDFFIKTLLDKQPYSMDASIDVDYAAKSESHKVEQLSLFENEKKESLKHTHVFYSSDRWAGYKHQPVRNVYYYGMSYFIPYQELNSNLLRDGNANIQSSRAYNKTIVDKVSEILSINYVGLNNNSISNEKRKEEVISAVNTETEYSENHMGCGEGRLLKLVDALENAPNKSLFVIEEPETALHQLAQHKLALYFLDICLRKRHQIIFTTHSAEIVGPLPIEARKYIERQDASTLVVDNATIAMLNNRLSGGYCKGLTIVTEDSIAKKYLLEIIRRFKPELLNDCEIISLTLGDSQVRAFIKGARECNFSVCAILDENEKKNIANYILAFPENVPPEKAVFSDEQIKKFYEEEYNYDITKLDGDHHSYIKKICDDLAEPMDYISARSIKEYVKSKSYNYYKEILENISQWVQNLK